MYTLYLLASVTTFYYIYTKIKRFLSIKDHRFDDLVIKPDSVEFEFLDIIYEDYTRDFLEDVYDFDFILHSKKPIKYATINYSICSTHYSVLFNKQNLMSLATLTFPFYDNVVKLPLYREVEKAVIIINDTAYDITNVLLDFAGPKLNYHSDIVKVRFEDIIDYSQEFPELLNVNGIINIYDNFGDKHIYNYPGEFTWKENLLD